MRLLAFMDEHVYAAEPVAAAQVTASGDEQREPPIAKDLKQKARAQGLWNLFLPDDTHGAGLKNWEYGLLCEVMGRIKVIAANMMMTVLDRAIQVFGAMGVSDDTPIALMWREGRSMRLADGPDEVHKMTVARRELRKWCS